MSRAVIFSSLLRETRQAIELIGDKIEQFTCCAAAKRSESILSLACKVNREHTYAYYIDTYVYAPIDFSCVSIIQLSVSLNNSSMF